MHRIAVLSATCLIGFSSVAAESESWGWGVDGCINTYASASERPALIRLLRESHVGVERERSPNDQVLVDGKISIDGYKNIVDSGLRVVAFANLDKYALRKVPGEALPYDLLEVYEAASNLAERYSDSVAGWEMVGEGDIGGCRDLPERVVAYQKALYLGLKDGGVRSGRDPIVVMGALGLPPGRWLERAARDGLLEYTDAYNFHFYGRENEFLGVLLSHKDFAERGVDSGRRLPIWITECGIDVMAHNQSSVDPVRLAAENSFFETTARESLACESVALFMPFILCHQNDGFALSSHGLPLPTWNSYSNFCRTHRWPRRPVAAPAIAPSTTVMQWLYRPGSALPHKVSGSYRFIDSNPIDGSIRIYNLSNFERSGVLTVSRGQKVLIEGLPNKVLVIPPWSVAIVPLKIDAHLRSQYFYETIQICFVETKGKTSTTTFSVETDPRNCSLPASSLSLANVNSPPESQFPTKDIPSHVSTDKWRSINGMTITHWDGSVLEARAEDNGDPLAPPLAASIIQGLPRDGFIRLERVPGGAGGPFRVRVDLIDDIGERYSIWEEAGVPFDAAGKDSWLRLGDMSPFFWGKCVPAKQYDSSRIREIQLRIYPTTRRQLIRLKLSVVKIEENQS